MRFSMMWPSVFTYIRHCMLFSQKLNFNMLHDLWRVITPRDSIISLILYILFNKLASSCIYAGWHISENRAFAMRSIWFKRVYEVHPKKTFLLAKLLSKQTATNSNTYSRLNRHLSPNTMENTIFACLPKKSNYLKADFLSYHQILF